ncbi:hypothetical protein Agub_g4030, partial [Astrephomene gubernaculifera]
PLPYDEGENLLRDAPLLPWLEPKALPLAVQVTATAEGRHGVTDRCLDADRCQDARRDAAAQGARCPQGGTGGVPQSEASPAAGCQARCLVPLAGSWNRCPAAPVAPGPR